MHCQECHAVDPTQFENDERVIETDSAGVRLDGGGDEKGGCCEDNGDRHAGHSFRLSFIDLAIRGKDNGIDDAQERLEVDCYPDANAGDVWIGFEAVYERRSVGHGCDVREVDGAEL